MHGVLGGLWREAPAGGEKLTGEERRGRELPGGFGDGEVTGDFDEAVSVVGAERMGGVGGSRQVLQGALL